MTKSDFPSTPRHCRDCPTWKKSVFAELGDAELDTLAEHKTCKVYERGETMSVQGAPVDAVYCMSVGISKVTRTTSIVRIAGPGDLLGYRCIFTQERFRATSSLLDTSVACRIDKSLILKMIDDNPRFSREILTRMGGEIAAAEDHHHSFCQKNVRERLAEALVLLKNKCGRQTTRGWLLEIRLSRGELANWIGTAKESAVRCLSEFREEGLVEQEADFLLLTDLAKLIAIAGLG